MIPLLEAPTAESIAPILANLGLDPAGVRVVDLRYPEHSRAPALESLMDKRRIAGAGHAYLSTVTLGAGPERTAVAIVNRTAGIVSPDGALLLGFAGEVEDAELCAWRNALWPQFHVTEIYRQRGAHFACMDLCGRRELGTRLEGDAQIAVLRRRAHVLAAEGAAGAAARANGDPRAHAQGQERRIRSLVERLVPGQAGARALDLSGASVAQGSPAPGETPRALVISAGALGAALDLDAWLDRLSSCVRPGGHLVIGDLNPLSRAMRARRARAILLPIGELGARAASDIRARLEARGLRFDKLRGHPLSFRRSQAEASSQAVLGAALLRPLLWADLAVAEFSQAMGGAGAQAFDCWVMRFERPL